MVGEVFNGDPSYVCPYQNSMSGVLNFPTQAPVTIESDLLVLICYADIIGSHKHSSLPAEASATLSLASIKSDLLAQTLPCWDHS